MILTNPFSPTGHPWPEAISVFFNKLLVLVQNAEHSIDERALAERVVAANPRGIEPWKESPAES